jgi:hypothetical protein
LYRYKLALVIRALSGFCDGVMTLSKGCMARISDKTNSARAFSTFGGAVQVELCWPIG